MSGVRLNAYLARAGVASRRKADDLSKAGRVTVNGEPGQPNTCVAAHDHVEVDGQPSDEALRALERGVMPEDGVTSPARVRRLAPSRIELTIHEGRNRRVRRMLEAVGHPVTRLYRSGYVGLSADDLEPGAWRELERAEVEQLRSLA